MEFLKYGVMDTTPSPTRKPCMRKKNTNIIPFLNHGQQDPTQTHRFLPRALFLLVTIRLHQRVLNCTPATSARFARPDWASSWLRILAVLRRRGISSTRTDLYQFGGSTGGTLAGLFLHALLSERGGGRRAYWRMVAGCNWEWPVCIRPIFTTRILIVIDSQVTKSTIDCVGG